MKALVAKIGQLNDSQSSRLNPGESKRLEEIAGAVEQGKVVLNDADWMIMNKLVFEWSVETRFPGIDLLRLIILHVSIPTSFLQSLHSFFNDGISDINAMLLFRVYANLFNRSENYPGLENSGQTLQWAVKLASRKHKNLQMAIVTYMIK